MLRALDGVDMHPQDSKAGPPSWHPCAALGHRVESLRASASPAAQWGHQVFWRAVKKWSATGQSMAHVEIDLPSLWILWNSLIWILFPYGLLRIQSLVNIFFFNLSLKICFQLTKITEWKGRGGVSPGPLPFCYVLYTLWNSPRPNAHEISYSSLPGALLKL